MANTSTTDTETQNWRDLVYPPKRGGYGNGKWPKNGPDLIREADLLPDTPVELINLQLRPFRVALPVRKDRNGKDVLQRIRIMPFESFMVAAEYAIRLLDRPMDNPEHMTYQIRGLVVAPPIGDCGGKQFFQFRGNGYDPAHRWETCCYADCPRHPAPGQRTSVGDDGVTYTYPAIKHSILMAQHLVRGNGNPLAVKRYVEDFDPRYQVAAFAYKHIEVLEQHKIERMGVPQASQRRRSTAVG